VTVSTIQSGKQLPEPGGNTKESGYCEIKDLNTVTRRLDQVIVIDPNCFLKPGRTSCRLTSVHARWVVRISIIGATPLVLLVLLLPLAGDATLAETAAIQSDTTLYEAVPPEYTTKSSSVVKASTTLITSLLAPASLAVPSGRVALKLFESAAGWPQGPPVRGRV